MGERETTDPRQDCPWKCKTGSPDCLCDQTGFARSACISTGPQCAPAPAEAVAWKDALAVIQRHIEQLEGKERTAQFLAVTVSLEKNASRTIGELHETMRSTVDTLKHVPTHPAPARGEAVETLDRIRGAAQHCECAAFGLAQDCLARHNGFTHLLAAPVPSAAPAREEVTEEMVAKADEYGWGHMSADDAMDTIVSVAALASCHKVGCEARDKGPFFCDCSFSDAAVSLSNYLRAARPDAETTR